MVGILAYLAPVLVFINLCSFLFWISMRKYLYLLIPMLALAVTFNIWRGYFALNFFDKQDFKPATNRFSMMSYNVRLLDLYKWSGKADTREKMIRFLQKENTDILCLQEFYTGNDSVGFDNINAIKYACKYDYVEMCDVNVNKRGRWGSVVFSKFPIIASKTFDIDVKGSNRLQQLNLKFNQDTISIFNIHLKSNRFTIKESELVAKKELPHWDDTTLSRTRTMYDKVLNNTISRGLEAELVSNIIAQNRHTTIVCGDLNDIASSYVYFKMKYKLKDAFLEKGHGVGATFGGTIPLLRIDYLFYKPTLKLLGFETKHIDYSDHFPLKANFELSKMP